MTIKLVDEWHRLWKSWSLWAITAGISLPDILQFAADHTDLMPWFDDGYKSGIRLACLFAAMILRPINQNLKGRPDETDAH